MIKIYHNPRCGKSREGLAIVEASKQEFKIIKYLDNHISFDEMKALLKMLGIPAMDLVRKNEAVWKEKYKGKTLSEDDIINAMLNNPKLIERPIVVNNNKKAVIGRPPELIKTIL